MFIQFLGLLVFAVGSVMAFGVYGAFQAVQVKTISVILIPLLHLWVGFGLVRWKNRARYRTFCLCSFYLFLGILSFAGVLSAVDFIPIVSLIEYIPEKFLQMNPSVIRAISLFVVPILVMLFLSLKSVAAKFEPMFKGYFAWGDPPLGVVLAGAVIFSYSFLVPSEISFFIARQERSIFGFPLMAFYGRLLRYVEFFLPLVLTFGLASGGRLIWALTLASVFYYWSSPIFNGALPSHLNDVRFLLFGIGWFFVAFILLYHRRFFLNQRKWLEERANIKLRLSGPLELHQPAADTESRLGHERRTLFGGRMNRARFIFFSLLIATAFFGGIFYFWNQKSPKPIPEIATVPEPASLKPAFRLEGLSVDAHGAYAIIDGSVVQIGTVVQGYQIEAIEQHRIILSKEGKHYWLDDEGNFQSGSSAT